MVEHPAKFSDPIIEHIARTLPLHLPPPARVLDPFAGVGGVHRLRDFNYWTEGVELEKEWALEADWNFVGDATDLSWIEDSYYDAIVTSPCYGNRMADHHDAKDGSKRHTYKHTLGRDLHPNNAGAMQWGGLYRDLHWRAWREAIRVLRPGGLFVLNTKNHCRRGKVQKVTEWHLGTLFNLGLAVEQVDRVRSPGIRHGANRKRVEFETVAFLRKDE